MIALYRAMTLTRIFDAKAIALQRTGQLGTYPSCAGQEAVGIGYASAMTAEDVMFITYREQAAQIWRGVTLTELLQFWGGDERGSDYSGPREDFPLTVTIAGQAPHAVGVATAFKLRNESRVAVCALGDGATSKGDFYEAVNLAGVWRLPVVFVVINNFGRSRCRARSRRRAKRSRKRRLPEALPGSRSTATISLPCARRWTRRWRAPATAKARASSKPSPIAWAITPPPTMPRAIAARNW